MLKPENRKKGVIEPEALPSDYIMTYCKPYLGQVLMNSDCTAKYFPESDYYVDLLVS